MLDIAKKEFDFNYSKSTTFNSEPVTLQYEDSSHWGKEGYRYSGYLVFVVDEKDQIVKVESNKGGYESNIVKIRKAKVGNILDGNFNVVNNKSRRVY
ncbi:hypothetical protein P4B35_13180 [Pontiellaceae bacterium B12227]|nr:hypothetical protein [Pontiellaceae bacterium B12227]